MSQFIFPHVVEVMDIKMLMKHYLSRIDLQILVSLFFKDSSEGLFIPLILHPTDNETVEHVKHYSFHVI